MKKMIGTATVLTALVMSVAAFAAEPETVNTATLTATISMPLCGAVVDPDLGPTGLAFGSVTPGQTTGAMSLWIENEGTADTTGLLVRGTRWCTGSFNGANCITPVGPSMPIGSTNLSDDIGSTWKQLTGAGVSILGGVLVAGEGNEKQIEFELTPPNNAAPGSYSQIVTFVGTCEGEQNV